MYTYVNRNALLFVAGITDETQVTIDAISPAPKWDEKKTKLTGANRKYVQILCRYLESRQR